jgi:hypothetical protein
MRRLGSQSRSARPARCSRPQLEPLEQRQLLDGALAAEAYVPLVPASSAGVTGLVRELPGVAPVGTADEAAPGLALVRVGEPGEGADARLSAADGEETLPEARVALGAGYGPLDGNAALDLLCSRHPARFDLEGWLPANGAPEHPATETGADRPERHRGPVLTVEPVPSVRAHGEEGLIAAQLFAGIALVCRQEWKRRTLRDWRSPAPWPRGK